jgi:hypothetical protein
MEDNFNPVVELQPEEIASIAAILAHPGFKAYMKIWKGVVDNFVVKFLNVDYADDNKILKYHMVAKLAAQMFTDVTNRVNEEVDQFISSRPSDIPVDVTANLLDMGEIATSEEEPLF